MRDSQLFHQAHAMTLDLAKVKSLRRWARSFLQPEECLWPFARSCCRRGGSLGRFAGTPSPPERCLQEFAGVVFRLAVSLNRVTLHTNFARQANRVFTDSLIFQNQSYSVCSSLGPGPIDPSRYDIDLYVSSWTSRQTSS